MMKLSEEFKGSGLVNVDISPAGLASWTEDDFLGLLQIGMTASLDFVGGEMGAVVEHNTSQLTEEDQRAYAAFFLRKPE
jgi:hypothetical protein